MSLVIIDKPPSLNFFSLENAKNIGRFVFKKTRGPQAVIESLKQGLQELGVDFRYNPKIGEIKNEDTVYVTGSLNALRQMIELKEKNKIKKLVAGPTLVVTPDDASGIIKNKNIDIYLVPSQWTKDFYASFGSNDFNQKLKIWPAGVALPKAIGEKKNNSCLVYVKTSPPELLKKAVDYLRKNNFEYNIIRYGRYRKKDYLALLEKASFMVYLQNVESQGIALLEAWAYNVPTLVWDAGDYVFSKINKVIPGPVSAPYLTEHCGLYFTEENLTEKFDYFLSQQSEFDPRDYVESKFSNKICAQNFIYLIN